MKSLFLFLAVFIFSKSFAQEAKDNFLSRLDTYTSTYPQEKMYIQTDRSFYAAGESIWLKGWCTLDGIPSYLSRIMYVDLVDASGNIIEKKMYRMDSLASSGGVIDLSDSIAGGSYTLRGYTLWMINFPDFVFKKTIHIYDKAFREKEIKNSASNQILLQFFPEGGELVAGVNNFVAFKANDGFGMPVAITGTVKANGEPPLAIQTTHEGMGYFEIIPKQGIQYSVEIDNSLASNPYLMPEVLGKGIALHINNSASARLFALLNIAPLSISEYSTLYLVAQMQGRLVFYSKLTPEDGKAAVSINKKNLPAGIVHITVFDSILNPLAERIAFVENYSTLQPTIDFEVLNTKPRGRNVWTIQMDSTIQPDVSILVANVDFDSAAANNHILTSLLLTSDVKGHIHNPANYFNKDNPKRNSQLDLLLMTNGWRRFVWKSVLSGIEVALKFPVETSLRLTGITTKSDRNIAVQNGKVSVMIRAEDSTSILSDAYLTDKGEFMVNDLHFNRKADITYQGTNNNKENLQVDVSFYPSYIDTLQTTHIFSELNIDTINIAAQQSNMARYMYSNLKTFDTSKVHLLENVDVKARRRNPTDSLNDVYTSGPFSLLSNSLDPSTYSYYSTIWQMLRVAIPGISVEGDILNPVISFGRFAGNDFFSSAMSGTDGEGSGSFTAPNGMASPGGVSFFLNEIQVNQDVINTLLPDDIALIKVDRGPGGMALGASEGVIAFYTKKGIPASQTALDKKFNSFTKLGYSLTRQFYSPDYTLSPLTAVLETGDIRPTIFWNARLQKNSKNQYQVYFHNSDNSPAFRVLVQGIDAEGKIILYEKTIR